jgi:hypothetical protein
MINTVLSDPTTSDVTIAYLFYAGILCTYIGD